MIDTIAKITLYVNDQEEAKRFWTDTMGFVVRLEQQAGPDFKWLEVGTGDGKDPSFVLYEKKLMAAQNPQVNTGHPSLILQTKDIKKAYDFFTKQGVKVGELMHMPYGSMFQFFDQDDNAYMLREN